MTKLFFSFLLLTLTLNLFAQEQPFTYAEVTDLHIGTEAGLNAAINTVQDINKNPAIQFVLITGDLTNNGSYAQLSRIKEIIAGLNKPYYVIPGNHEETWSASGGTFFKQLFKTDRFMFERGGYCFIGTDCGPVLKHGLSHTPKDNLIWLDSTLTALKDKNEPVIFVNHYPMTKAMDNSQEVIRILKKYNIQLILCGHGHTNRKLNFSGIPGIMCRANEPIKGAVGGYNIVNVANNQFSFSERRPSVDSLRPAWATITLKPIPKASIRIAEPDYSINTQYPGVKIKWQYDNTFEINSGFSIDGAYLYSGTYDGKLIALNKETGEKAWSYPAGGRIFSTPAISGDHIVFTSTNGFVYCLNKQGKLLWKYHSDRAVVCSPAIRNNKIFIGFSDNYFRCLDLDKGSVLWSFDGIKGAFVLAMTLYKDKVYFGAWNSHVYALDQNTGKLIWSWTNDEITGYSPAFLAPIAVNHRIFVVTPDYYITSLDAATGKVIWRQTNSDIPVWFSMGLAKDSSALYVKARNNKGFGLSTMADSLKVLWQAPLNLDDDNSVTPIVDDGERVYFASVNGLIIVVDKKSSKTIWQYKFSNSSLSMIKVISQTEIYASSTDGKIVRLSVE